MSSKLSTSREDSLNPTTRNLLSLLSDIPVITIRRTDSGRKDAERIFNELKELSGEGFQVFENKDSLNIVRDGASRTFML